MHEIHIGSTEYMRVPVAVTVNGAPINPTSLAVSFSIVATTAAAGTFTAGTWETETVNGVTTYYARALIEAGSFGATNLPVGEYRVFVKIVDNPESPIIDAGTIRIYD